MKRFIVTAIEIIICFLLQTTVFQWFPFVKVSPNLLLVLVISVGYMRGRNQGLLIGFVCGLLIDMYYGSYMGVCALIYLLIGYASGYSNKVFLKEDISVPIILITLGELAYFFMYYVLEFLLRGRLNIGFYFINIGLPRIIFTLVVGILQYRILNRISIRLDSKVDEEV